MKTGNSAEKLETEVEDFFWGPLSAGVLILAIGLVGFVAGEPLLFPSLGPTAFLQIEDPNLRAAKFYNTLVGHLVGLGSGLLAVFVLRADQSSSVLATGYLAPVRVAASALAIALTIAIGLLLRASHPPASATTLLVALGAFKAEPRTVAVVVIGIVLVAFLGEGLRRVRLNQYRKGEAGFPGRSREKISAKPK